ncbi:MAG TPA: flagellar export protein FliJ [Bacteroidota bacterium]|nr:flagellar export protein FliJ [Bacteroidota bacterium]
MAKPSSRFGTLLRLKKHQEKLTQQQLLQIQRTHLQEKEMLDKLREAREEAMLESYSKGRTKATDLQTHRAFIFNLSRQITTQTSKVHEISKREQATRAELTKKAQARQIVEKLDEKMREEALREAERKNQSMLDDVAQRSGGNGKGRLPV